MHFCIDSRVLGTPKHFVVEDGSYAWSESLPRTSWHMTGSPKASPTAKCLDTLFALIRHVPASIPPQHRAAFETVASGSLGEIPWASALPGATFQKFFKNLVGETEAIFPKLPFAYHEAAWAAGSRVLSSLRPAKINEAAWRELSESESPPAGVESFSPNRSGFAKVPTYDRFATKTGRLTVTSGPNILVIKRDARSVLTSSFPGGSVVSLDFRALEARIVLAEAGRSLPAGDLYDDVRRSLFGDRVARDAVKVAVISELYGASKSALAMRMGVPLDEAERFSAIVKEHFRVPHLRARLKDIVSEKGSLSNAYGRPLFVSTGQDNLLVNAYAQSTGVDVALLGFDAVINLLGGEGIRPLFVLHDALILDVRSDRIAEVEATTSIPVPTYNFRFPLKFERVST